MSIVENDRGYSWPCPVCCTHDATMTDMARVALCPTHGRTRPLWRTWAEPRYQYPTDGPEAA